LHQDKQNDATLLLSTFSSLKEADPEFLFSQAVDENNRLEKVAFSFMSASSRASLGRGSVVLDTTHKTNKYGLYLAVFAVETCLKQTDVIMYGFISKQDKDSFIWLIKEFISAIGGGYPEVRSVGYCSLII
jgi:zinc finger SWIM domain-containing protein 3